jgi:hypothetical protein
MYFHRWTWFSSTLVSAFRTVACLSLQVFVRQFGWACIVSVHIFHSYLKLLGFQRIASYAVGCVAAFVLFLSCTGMRMKPPSVTPRLAERRGRVGNSPWIFGMPRVQISVRTPIILRGFMVLFSPSRQMTEYSVTLDRGRLIRCPAQYIMCLSYGSTLYSWWD